MLTIAHRYAENSACNCWIFGKRGMTLLAVSTQEVIEAILGSIDEAIHAVDENGITIFYNSVAAKHDGSKIEKVLGKHLLEVFPSLSRETSTLMKVLDTKTYRTSSTALSKFKW